MRVLWKLDGVEVIATGIVETGDALIRGFATKEVRKGGLGHLYRYEWMATPTSRGWEIWTKTWASHRKEMYTGPTYNLGLEVAAAVRRAL